MTKPLGYTRGEVVLQGLGSFWSRIFRDKEFIKEYVHGIEKTLSQAYFNLLEIILTKSVHDIPIFHREKWKLLVFKESEANTNTESLLKYSVGDFVYGAQGAGSDIPGFVFSYGGFAPGPYVSYALPDDMVDLESYICNRIYEPSLVLKNGTDFFIKNGVIFFKTNPFSNDLITKREITNEHGEVVDREISIWALNSDHDYELLWKHYGYIIDIYFESSENYKDFLRSVWALFTKGPRLNTLVATLNAMLGLPIIRDEEELIQTIQVENGIRTIVTDKNLYELREDVSVNSSVYVGNTLQQFDNLSDAVIIIDNVSVPKWWNNRRFLPLPVSLLTEDYLDSLKVFNDPVEIDLNYDSTFTLPVLGNMTPAKQDLMNNFPLQWGTTGWNWNDTKLSIRGLDFVMDHYYKNNTFLLEIKVNEIEAGRVTADVINLLNEALPAYIYFIGLLDIELFEDEYELDDTDGIDDGLVVEDKRGQRLIDDYAGGTLLDDFTDGHDGFPRWNDCLRWGPPNGWQYNIRTFIPCVRVRLKQTRCST